MTLDPFLKVLGRPTRENVVTRRDDEATLLQALELTNGTFFNDALAAGAERWVAQYREDPGALVEHLYRKALGRAPSRAEANAVTTRLGETPTSEAMITRSSSVT